MNAISGKESNASDEPEIAIRGESRQQKANIFCDQILDFVLDYNQ